MLRCISTYSSNRGTFGVGDLVTDPELVAFLLVDSPDSFEADTPQPEPEPEPEVRAVEAPPAHRQVTRETRGTQRRKAGG